MEAREIADEVARLAAERNWKQGSPQEAYLLALFAAREDAREDARHALLRHAESLRYDLDRLEKILRAPSPLLNTLGWLQQRPAAVEAYVGAFDAADKTLRAYLEAFPATGTISGPGVRDE